MEASTLEASARVLPQVLPHEVLAELERDVNTVIEAFDSGWQPPARPGSLTSGAPGHSPVLELDRHLKRCRHPPPGRF